MAFGVTDAGFNAKRTEDVKKEVEEDLQGVFGDQIDLSPETPFGQVVGILSDRLGSIWSFMEQVYNAFVPSAAEGVSLDNVSSITGATRLAPTSSKVDMVLTGTAGTVIPAGSIISVDGNAESKFATDTESTIQPGVNNKQTITFPTLPEAGSFTLDFDGAVTSSLDWNASNAAITAALEALTNIGVGNVSVTGDVQTGFFVVEFIGDLEDSPRPLITVGANSLTSAEVTQVETVADVSGSLDRTTVLLYDGAATSVGVWSDNNDDGSTIPPAAAGANRPIEVTGISDDDTANSVAAAWAASVNADPAFAASAVGNVITVTDQTQGARTAAADVDTGFTVTRIKQGYVAGSLPIDIAETQEGVLPQAAGVGATATQTGPVQGPAGTITVIETPVSGWTGASNPLDADPVGTDLESDIDFRIRRIEEIALAGRATTEAIKARVLEVEGVTAVVVFENDTEITDPEGRPPNCVDIVAQGGTEEDIGQAIFDAVAAGIQRIGDIDVDVIDSQGFIQTQWFSRPTDVDIYIELDLTVDANFYPADGDDQVSLAVVTHGDSLGIGTDVIVHGTNSVEASIREIPGILNVVIRIGKTASPTTDDNIEIDPREISAWDSSRVTVNS